MKIFIYVCTLLFAGLVNAKELVLPSLFENNRVFLIPTLESGEKIKFYTDTGGGWNAISTEMSNKFNWDTITEKEDGNEFKLTSMPNFKKGMSIPAASKGNSLKGYLVVVDKKQISTFGNFDGFLGGRWFAEKIVFWDYVDKTVSLLDSINDIKNINSYDVIDLGFQKENGKYTTAFPSIDIIVDGKILPMLFDTGATVQLSDGAKKALNETSGFIATSFITTSVFNQWQKDHPDWIVIDKADHYVKEPMIRVPHVKIGNRTVGPVWFARRADTNFHDYMFKMMDKKAEGAIGGSLLQYLRVIVDYPNEKAYICD